MSDPKQFDFRQEVIARRTRLLVPGLVSFTWPRRFSLHVMLTLVLLAGFAVALQQGQIALARNVAASASVAANCAAPGACVLLTVPAGAAHAELRRLTGQSVQLLRAGRFRSFEPAFVLHVEQVSHTGDTVLLKGTAPRPVTAGRLWLTVSSRKVSLMTALTGKET